MLDKDNIISTSVSEAVEKIPTDEKDYRKCSFMCFTLHSYSIQKADQHIYLTVEVVLYLLGYIPEADLGLLQHPRCCALW